MFLLYFRLFTFSDLYGVCVSVFSCTVLFVSISQVIGCEDRLWNDLYCVQWGVNSTPSIHSATAVLAAAGVYAYVIKMGDRQTPDRCFIAIDVARIIVWDVMQWNILFVTIMCCVQGVAKSIPLIFLYFHNDWKFYNVIIHVCFAFISTQNY